MTLSRIGRISKAFVVSIAIVLGMSACGGYTVGFMWVLGTQYNQISGFKIDDYTGNLTNMVNSPYSSGGTDPVSIAVRIGGNFVFVVNKGTSPAKCDGNVSVFAVGEDGILTFQASYPTQGCSPVWAIADGSGSYLYVLDSQAPTYNDPKDPLKYDPSKPINLDGDITVFAVDASTGRLQLVPNQSIKNAAGTQLTYFEVGQVPTMLRVSANCLFTLDSGDQTIYPYGVGTGGQLVVEVNSTVKTNTVNMTSINATGNSIYLTDAGKNQIVPYNVGSGCSLVPQVDGAVTNLPLTANPVYTMTDSRGKFLYVLNHGTTISNQANSTISAFTIEPTGSLVPISDPQNPYSVGSGPVCMVEDPSNQYVYTSNSNDGSVTGKYINQNTGQLSDLSRGSQFPASGLSSCLAVSGNVN